MLESAIIQPTAERMRHDEIRIVGSQIQDSAGNIGVPFENVGILRLLEERGSITSTQRTAGHAYMDDWDIAGIESLRAAPFEILGKGRDSITERRLAARDRWWKATQALGGLGSPCERAAWYILGMRANLAQWVAIEGGRLTSDSAKGILIGTLGVLAQHYGLEAKSGR